MAWHNENDPKCVAWLRSLIDTGELENGVVDERSIVDIKADDVPVGGRAHFFAGIGGWELALRWAGVSDELEVWTGSCPCQPFSTAGKKGGVNDERHLWPEWRRLIAERRPSILFGEQVASKAGRAWLANVRSDLEKLGYAVGAADLCAAGVGAPHIRQRLFFGAVRLADADFNREVERRRGKEEGGGPPSGIRRNSASYWPDLEWLPCRDGKWRPTQPGLFPLAHGLPARVGRLRGYGNAIVPQVAAEFVKGFFEAL